MAQRMNMGVFGNPTCLESQAKSALKRAATHWFLSSRGTQAAVTFGGEEHRGMTMGFPLLAQKLQCPLRQRYVTVLVSLAAADVQEHALGIDVANLEAQAFAQSQTARVNGR